MKFPNLHIFWTEGENLSLPNLLSRWLTTTTQDEHRLRTVEIPDWIKFFMKHIQYTKPIQCHYAVSKEYVNSISADADVESQRFPIYLKFEDNYFKVQLENDLYLPVSHYKFQTKAQPLDYIQQQKIQHSKLTTHSQNSTLSYNTQM